MTIKLEDLIPGGKGDKLSKKDVDKKELEMGIKVEMEHTNDKAKAEEIALDHLSEDPKYYSKLKKSGLADELDESYVGNMYITIGESIEKIENEYKKIKNFTKYINTNEFKLQMYKLENVIKELKNIFGDVYYFSE